MKKMLLVLFCLFYTITNSQTVSEWKDSILNDPDLSKKEWKQELSKNDFSTLWKEDSTNSVLGFIGENYQRLYIKILSIYRDSNKLNTYHISGKSKVKNNICPFNGIIAITNIRCYKNMHFGVDDEYKDKGIKREGIIVAKYRLNEDSTKPYSGLFKGILISFWYLDKNNKIQYDNIESGSDDYCNNQFVGTWKGYNGQKEKQCNWGQCRIPLSGDLDNGAGEFAPDDKYLKYGWQTYIDAYEYGNKKARIEEEIKWWRE